MASFFAELQRRNVYRVGAAYLFVSWVIAQLAEIAVPALILPEWVNSLVFLLLMLGFPIALVFAWAFDLSPEGVRLTTAEDLAGPDTKQGRRLEIVILILMAMILGYYVLNSGWLGRSAEPGTQESSGYVSIAVLPFVDMSATSDQAFFADGLSEEILNLLAQEPNLQVTSRSSAFSYKGKSINIREVGQDLGVSYVLEGSVRKSGDRVRVTAQLIESATDRHVWSETYDRTLSELFVVQDDISGEVVRGVGDSLGLTLSEQPAPARILSPTAYESFLLAQSLIRERRIEGFERAILELESVLAAEPDYPAAVSQLALAHLLRAEYSGSDSALVIDRFLSSVESAAAAAPDDPMVLGVHGFFLAATFDLNGAISSYERALGINPSLTDVRIWYAIAMFDSGEVLEARRQYELAYLNDPLSIQAMRNFISVKINFREFRDLEPTLERLERISPEHGVRYRAQVLDAQMQLADGFKVLHEGYQNNPDSIGLRQEMLISLYRVGIPLADLIDLWPLEPPSSFTFMTLEAEERLAFFEELLLQRPLDQHEWRQYVVTLMEQNRSAQLRSALDRRYATVEPVGNELLWQRYATAWLALAAGDRQGAADAVQSSYEALTERLDAGWRTPDTLLDASILEYIVNPDLQSRAIRLYAQALSGGVLNPTERTFGFRVLNWGAIPALVDLLAQSDAALAAERDAIVAHQCTLGPAAFWRPGPEQCSS